MDLQGFDIDFCTLAAGTPGVGVLEYAALDTLDLSSFEPAVDQAYVFRRTLSATWHPMPFVVGTGSFTEDHAAGAQGSTFRQALQVFLPGDSAAVRAELSEMRHRRFLVRMVGRDGSPILLGTPEQPLRFDSRFSTGPQGGDQRGHQCTFQGVALQKAPIYTPTW